MEHQKPIEYKFEWSQSTSRAELMFSLTQQERDRLWFLEQQSVEDLKTLVRKLLKGGQYVYLVFGDIALLKEQEWAEPIYKLSESLLKETKIVCHPTKNQFALEGWGRQLERELENQSEETRKMIEEIFPEYDLLTVFHKKEAIIEMRKRIKNQYRKMLGLLEQSEDGNKICLKALEEVRDVLKIIRS